MSNKAEYIYADYFRLICAIGIVALHLDPFYNINKPVDFFVGSVLTRLCVPFFFLLSGFFLKDKLSDWERTKKYVGHLTRLYIVYTIIYLPIIFYNFKDNEKTFTQDILFFLRNLFCVGSYGQLWYFLALIFACLFLYIMIAKLGVSDKAMMFITVILFLLGLFYKVYDKPIEDAVESIKIIALYDEIFKTSRNGLFFGTPFVYWGNLLWKKNIDINRKKCGILFLLAFICFTLEAIFVRNIIGARQLDMLFFMPVTTFLFVIFVLAKDGTKMKASVGIWCRKMSVLIFGLHLFVFFAIDKILDRIEIDLNNFVMFLAVLFCNLLLGTALFFLAKTKYGKWIEKVLL